MKTLKSLLKSVVISAATCATSTAIMTDPAAGQTQTIPACPATGSLSNFASYTSGCYGTPEVYKITFYEMGLCSSDPMAGGTLDKSTCTASFKDDGGIQKDIAGSSGVALGSGTGGTRPDNGSYKYAYAILSNTFRLKANYKVNTINYYSSSDYSSGSSNVTAGATSLAQEFDDNLTSFGQSCSTKGTETFSNGTMTAYVLNSGLEVATGCTGVTRLIGYMTLNTPIEIKPETEGLKMTFKVTNSGMTVQPTGDGQEVFAFSSGPFSASFTLIE